MFDETLSGWHDAIANRALAKSILKHARKEIPIKIADCFINDPAFADEAVSAMLKLIHHQKLDWERK